MSIHHEISLDRNKIVNPRFELFLHLCKENGIDVGEFELLAFHEAEYTHIVKKLKHHFSKHNKKPHISHQEVEQLIDELKGKGVEIANYAVLLILIVVLTCNLIYVRYVLQHEIERHFLENNN